ncbi:Cellular retinaldehyde binding/alpha-tocopherol transport,CRAL/TRIO, N-terminal domain,CRAL-TRIO lipid [Cinara cedri]|uniref:Cellular retinaldehyde binding/alpha-tocopherol transport,CRAL/TRIO, N-terminal domain,CRAL-TRIO lipid n=1 Tax=Cinara cedri TaxID=506608 RepID=A0A5E4NB57_9HEMI|nr:Cellular retinaldehyde binding/alpha-tocopherol transport,CRAL/TRIO, N-terminal domain,CRAL-TRIO lipid [Cinara cedri]
MALLPPNNEHKEAIKKLYFFKEPEKIEDDIDVLIEWLSKQPHLPNITDRQWLKHFLIGRKNNLPMTKKVIESYFTVREEIPGLFNDMTSDAEWIQSAVKVGKLSLLPKMTPEANRVHIIRSIENRDVEFNAMVMCKGSLKTIDYLMRREPIYGMIFLLDLKYCQLSYLLSFTPSLTKNLMRCIDEATPLRVRGVHYVNPPKFVARLVNFFKIFMPSKIQDRICVHETFDTLYDYIPKDVLPYEYGGTAGSVEKFENDFMESVKEDDEWYRNMPRADLSKRPIKSKNVDMDMSGTFKKLDID